MQPVKITVKDGIGREVNPYSPYDPMHEPNSDLSRFDYFAKHNVGYPCPELANTKPGETVEAELVDADIDLGRIVPAKGKIWKLIPEQKQEGNYLTGESHKQLRRPEFIICAAIHYDDGIEYPHQANNIQTGREENLKLRDRVLELENTLTDLVLEIAKRV